VVNVLCHLESKVVELRRLVRPLMSRLIQVRHLPPNQHQLALVLHKQVLHAEVVARFPTAQGVVAICRELVPKQSVVALQMYDLPLRQLLNLAVFNNPVVLLAPA
jgi:hypothetical protein